MAEVYNFGHVPHDEQQQQQGHGHSSKRMRLDEIDEMSTAAQAVMMDNNNNNNNLNNNLNNTIEVPQQNKTNLHKTPLSIEPCTLHDLKEYISKLQDEVAEHQKIIQEKLSVVEHAQARVEYLRKSSAKRCSVEGCTNFAQRHNVCNRHGANKTARLCSHEGCTNHAKRQGKCKKHGATLKCTHEGCTNIARFGGVSAPKCEQHHGGTKPNYTKKPCAHAGCKNKSYRGNYCKRHNPDYASRLYCNVDDCTNQAVTKGYCKKHANGERKCLVVGCNNQDARKGFCSKHYQQGQKKKKMKRDKDGNVIMGDDDGINVNELPSFDMLVTERYCSFRGCKVMIQTRGGQRGYCAEHDIYDKDDDDNNKGGDSGSGSGGDAGGKGSAAAAAVGGGEGGRKFDACVNI